VPHPRRVEFQIFVEWNRKKSPRQLQSCQIAFNRQRIRAISCSHAEKRQVPPARIILEVARGMRHAVDFVKRIGEVGNARQVRIIPESYDSSTSKTRLSCRLNRVLAQGELQLA